MNVKSVVNSVNKYASERAFICVTSDSKIEKLYKSNTQWTLLDNTLQVCLGKSYWV